jgi:hypothetical protein
MFFVYDSARRQPQLHSQSGASIHLLMNVGAYLGPTRPYIV